MRTQNGVALIALIVVVLGPVGPKLPDVASVAAPAEPASRLPAVLDASAASDPPAKSLIPNGSFDRDTVGWRSFGEPASPGQAGWALHGGRKRGGALHIVSASGEARQHVAWTCTFDSLPIGRQLRVSAWVKGTGCEVAPVATATIVGSEGNLAAGTSRGTFEQRGEFDWTRLGVLVPVPDGSRSAFLSLLLTGAGEVWFDDVEAVSGDTLTATERRAEPLEKGPGLLRVHSAWEYSLRVGAAPARSSDPGPRLLIALPLEYREQVPLTFELSTRPPERIRAARVYQDRPGAWVARVDLAPLKGGQSVVLDWSSVVLVAPRSLRGFPSSAPLPSEWPAEARPWLAATLCAQADDPLIARVAATIRDTSQDARGIIEGTLLWMSRLRTDGREMCSVFDAVQSLDHRGSCVSSANLAVALLRANGIPARTLGGYPSWATRPMDCHFIVEAYVPGYGWFPMDPTRCVAPVRPSDQIQVSIVPLEYEDERAVRRAWGARGLPYLSIGELLGDSRSILRMGALDRERGGGVLVNQLQRYPRGAPDWDRALRTARERWASWLARKPALDPQGMLRTPIASDSLAEVRSPSALLGRLSAR